MNPIERHKKNVLQLKTIEDGQKFLNEQKYKAKILLLWGDFCGHCHNFIPEFVKLATDHQTSTKSDLLVASIESQVLPRSGFAKYVAGGFPTTVLFDRDNVVLIKSMDSRTAVGLVQEIFAAMPSLRSSAFLQSVATRQGGCAGAKKSAPSVSCQQNTTILKPANVSSTHHLLHWPPVQQQVQEQKTGGCDVQGTPIGPYFFGNPGTRNIPVVKPVKVQKK